jgi:tetratricopeptide (TPR) repeat protein
VVLAALLAMTLSAHSGRQPRLSADHPRHSASHSHTSSAEQHASPASSSGVSPAMRTTPGALAGGQPSIAVSPAAAVSLEAAGHQLLSQGRYAQAIGVLREAVQASGGSVARCAEPTSEPCLTFAYALYDLGSALRLEGDPHAAIPILSDRMEINNQRAAVEEQLDLARAGVV